MKRRMRGPWGKLDGEGGGWACGSMVQERGICMGKRRRGLCGEVRMEAIFLEPCLY